MKNNIKLVENNSVLDLAFGLPTSSLTEGELGSIYGGNVKEECPCLSGTLHCNCNGGASFAG